MALNDDTTRDLLKNNFKEIKRIERNIKALLDDLSTKISDLKNDVNWASESSVAEKTYINSLETEVAYAITNFPTLT